MHTQQIENRQPEMRSRSSNQIRNQFLANLTYQKVWLQEKQKPATSQTCIIFDWDDTIICTTFLMPYQRFIFDESLNFPANLSKKLLELDEIAWQILAESKRRGKTYIVTNAAEGWVELSARRFMPKTNEQLEGITVISARTKYEKLYPK